MHSPLSAAEQQRGQHTVGFRLHHHLPAAPNTMLQSMLHNMYAASRHASCRHLLGQHRRHFLADLTTSATSTEWRYTPYVKITSASQPGSNPAMKTCVLAKFGMHKPWSPVAAVLLSEAVNMTRPGSWPCTGGTRRTSGMMHRQRITAAQDWPQH
jgi:hypothetical protein